MVAAQGQLPHRLHRHLRAGLRGGDVVLVIILQHLVRYTALPLSPGHLQLLILLRLLLSLLSEDGRVGGEVQSDPQQLHQAAQLLEALGAGDHRQAVEELGQAGDDGPTHARDDHYVLQAGRESAGENFP